jgi:hypothetical protein
MPLHGGNTVGKLRGNLEHTSSAALALAAWPSSMAINFEIMRTYLPFKD